MEDEPLPRTADEGPRRSLTGRQRLLLAVLLLGALALSVVLLREQLAQQRALVRRDLSEAVATEERVRRFGLAEQALDLADPSAPDDWLVRYAASFGQPASDAEPRVREVEDVDDLAVVTLDYGEGPSAWSRLHAYRLAGSAWRRTPVPATLWEEPTAYHSEHFTLHLSERDAAQLPPEELLIFLEQFRGEFIELWTPAREGRLSLSIGPGDLLPVAAGQSAAGDEIALTSPLVAWEARYPFLAPPREYRLALAEALAAALDEGNLTGAGSMSEVEGARLREELRGALVRFLVLTEEEQRLYREWVRGVGDEGERGRAPDSPGDATLSFLLDYLLALRGNEAPGQLATALRRSVSLADATIQAFGLPLPALLREARLWMATPESEASEAPAQVQSATLLRVLDVAPFRAMAIRDADGALLQLHAAEEASRRLPVACLGTGSRLGYRAAGQEAGSTATEIEVRSMRLPSWPITSAPEGTRTLIARQVSGSTRIVALDEGGREMELASLPGEIELVMHPREAAFAFLYEDQCGVTVNQYVAQLGEITRAPVRVEGTGHLFWGEQLFLVDDVSSASAPYWAFTPVRLWDTRERFIRPLREPLTWGQFLGYSGVTGRYLLRSGEGELYWLDIIRWFDQRGVTLRPAGLALPADATRLTLSSEGRWLAYAQTHDEVLTSLYALDIAQNNTIWLLHLPPGAWVRDMAFGFGEPLPFLVALAPSADSQVSDHRLVFLGFPTETSVAHVDTSPVEGIVDNLHWCEDGRFLYRRTRGEEEELIEEYGDQQERSLGAYGEVLTCDWRG